MANFVAGQPYTGKVIDPSQGGAVVDYKPSTGSTAQALQQQQSGVQLTPNSSAITPSALTPAQPLQPVVTQPYTAPITAPLPPPAANVALTSQEQSALDQVSPYQQLIDQLSGQTSELSQKSFRKQQAESTGLNAATNLAQSLYDKNQSLDLRSQAILAQKQADIQGLQNTAQMGGANVTKGGLAPQQRAIETRSNQEQLANTLSKLDNAVSYYAASGKVREATQAVDAAVDAEFTPKLQALATAQANLKTLLDSPDLTSAQQKKALNLQAQYTAQENAIKDAAQLKKDTGDARIKALTNNPNMTQQQHDAISLAQSPEEVAQLVNYFGLTTLTPQEKLAQSNSDRSFNQSASQFDKTYALQKQTSDANVAKLKAETDALKIPSITNPDASKYSTALSTILGSQNFTKDQKANVVNAINNGQDPFTVIKNQAKNIMGQTEATKVTGYETAKAQLIDVDTALKQFYALGGKTSLFNGSYEKVINNLGEESDPKLVDLSTQIQSALQIYRNAVSGTAYSVQEGADIASIFPGINKSQGLNTSILTGRMKAFDSTIDGAYRSALGTTYDDINKSAQVDSIKITPAQQMYAKSNQSQLQAGEIMAVDAQGNIVAATPDDMKTGKYKAIQ